MRIIITVVLAVVLSSGCAWASVDEVSIETLLRSQVFNKEFEGYAFYVVTISSDELVSEGERVVVAEASGTFSEHVKRIKVRLLIVENRVVGGQVLEHQGLPPCKAVAGS
jgi:hypothetical protein